MPIPSCSRSRVFIPDIADVRSLIKFKNCQLKTVTNQGLGGKAFFFREKAQAAPCFKLIKQQKSQVYELLHPRNGKEKQQIKREQVAAQRERYGNEITRCSCGWREAR